MKAAGLIFVFVSSVLAGFLKSMQLDENERFWDRVLAFVRYAENTFRYLSPPTAEMIAEYNRTQPPFAPALRCAELCGSGLDLPDAWHQSVDELAAHRRIPADSRSLLLEFGAGLGATDLEGQLAHCRLFQLRAEERRTAAREEKKKKSRLYVLLGAAAGLGLNLLLW